MGMALPHPPCYTSQAVKHGRLEHCRRMPLGTVLAVVGSSKGMKMQHSKGVADVHTVAMFRL